MAPAFGLPVGSDDSSLSRSRSPAAGSALDEMAALEATYQESNIRPDDAVDFFAGQLDRYSTDLEGSPAEQRAQVLRLAESYYTYSRNKADRLYERQSRLHSARKGSWQGGASGDMDIDDYDDDGEAVSVEELRRAEEEAQTWDLLRRMLPLRYRDTAAKPKKIESRSPRQSRRQWWDDFLLSDSIARERKVILEWLQNSASQGPPIDEVVSELQQSAERGDILAHGWLHTRHKIKLQKSVNGYQGVLDPKDPGVTESHLGSNTLITQLDPDAITRQARKLEPQDEFFERAIWLGCFEMLRRGYTMSEIRDWCSVRTELWRAASLAPLPLSCQEDEDQADFDPASLILWNRTCFKTARDGGTSDYDRAVYGLLAGDISSVEKVCKSWDDYFFARYSALLRMQFDSFLIKHSGENARQIARKFPASDILLLSGEPTAVGRQLVADLEKREETKDEATRTLKFLQGAIIANGLDKHLQNQGIVLSRHANEKQKSNLMPESGKALADDTDATKYINLSDHDSLRILAHVLIIVSTLDRLNGFSNNGGLLDHRHRDQENIIAGYISYLRLANLEEMVPLYCSKLYGARVFETLSRNLIHIVGYEARVNQLTIMKKLCLDLSGFVKTQPEIYLGDVHDESLPCEAKGNFKVLEPGPATLKYGRIVKPDFFGEDAEHVDAEDERIIRALEWLMIVPGNLKETVAYAIRTYKYFLKRTRLRAARALSDRIPGREIIRSKTSVPIRSSSEDAGPSWFEEFTSNLHSDMMDDSDLDWEELTASIRNLWELECLVRALDSMETLSSLAGLAREENNSSREMWQHTSQEIRAAKACMQPVLKNWLLVSNEADPDFRELREAYIPETVLTFVSSLHFVGTSLSRDNLLECMELSAVIAEKGSDVAQEFLRSGRLKELLEAFAACSKALAIWTSDKKSSQPSSKKMREMGWSRELWSVKS
ncbi:nuclear pore protein 84/107 [Apodospora peruviana]|uniref:Nuclear pore complex protein n=1 Tax=Apodospora peruviana TaxID=516989 RepID=A0AAE0IS76_9PEZI|nr:nuclear pore protein 84/107 [Apodospora peruviana]